MRIIAGLFRGRKLKTLPGLELRPTPDRLRETLFDVLGPSVEGAVFIDAYAGSGAVGIEAISRGARQVCFIEENTAACGIIQANLSSLAIRNHVDVLRTSVRKGWRVLAARGIQANFCFLDPPYAARQEYAQCLRWLSETSVMEPHGLVIVQHSKREPLDEQAGQLSRVRLLTQGCKALSFYRFQASGVRGQMPRPAPNT